MMMMMMMMMMMPNNEHAGSVMLRLRGTRLNRPTHFFFNVHAYVYGTRTLFSRTLRRPTLNVPLTKSNLNCMILVVVVVLKFHAGRDI